jgi:hypothetical protein
LIKNEIFTKIAKPWFEFRWTPASNDYLGEDMILCEKISSAGLNCASRISKKFQVHLIRLQAACRLPPSCIFDLRKLHPRLAEAAYRWFQCCIFDLRKPHLQEF